MIGSWCRLYSEMPDDQKIGTLNDAEFRSWIELLCLAAGENNQGNTGVTLDSVDWRLRRNVTVTLQKLLHNNLIHKNEQNYIVISQWEKRQKKSDKSNERVKSHRYKYKEIKDKEKCNVTCNDDVTLLKQNCNGVDTDTDKRKNIKKEKVSQEEFILPGWIPSDLWDSFMDVRKTLKAANTVTAKKMIIARLEEYRAMGHDVKTIIENSITGSWKSVFPLKYQNDKRRPHPNIGMLG